MAANYKAQGDPARGVDALSVLLDGGVQLGSFTVPWSWIIVLVIVLVGLFIIKSAFTLIKVAILVAIAVGIYLLVKFAFHEFAAGT